MACGKKISIWILRPFKKYCTYIEPIVNQRWAKTGVSGEKPSDLLVQNLASHWCVVVLLFLLYKKIENR